MGMCWYVFPLDDDILLIFIFSFIFFFVCVSVTIDGYDADVEEQYVAGWSEAEAQDWATDCADDASSSSFEDGA